MRALGGGIKNLVFEGGGVLGTAYLGMLQFLDEQCILQDIQRVAGTSAGAITACIVSFNLDFGETKGIADSLDYTKVPATKGKGEKEEVPELFKQIEIVDQLVKEEGQDEGIERAIKDKMNNIDCIYRLIKKFGWYSPSYFYEWIRAQIASQFEVTKKAPPYTFADFKNSSIHKEGRTFKELYVVGADVSDHIERVFSYETTPDFEVAQAVRISMSIPLYFESIRLDQSTMEKSQNNIYVDGGLMWNYPIGLFDKDGRIARTLGGTLISERAPDPINNLLDFIGSVLSVATSVQRQLYYGSPKDMARSIPIYTGSVSPLDFDIKVGDEKYKYLYEQGYKATEKYFME